MKVSLTPISRLIRGRESLTPEKVVVVLDGKNSNSNRMRDKRRKGQKLNLRAKRLAKRWRQRQRRKA